MRRGGKEARREDAGESGVAAEEAVLVTRARHADAVDVLMAGKAVAKLV